MGTKTPTMSLLKVFQIQTIIFLVMRTQEWPHGTENVGQVWASALLFTLLYTPLCSAVGSPLNLILLGFLSPYVGHWWPALPSVSLGSKAPCGKVEKFQPFHWQVGAPKPGFLWRVSRSPHPPNHPLTHHLIGTQKDIAFERLKKFWELCSKKQK